MDRHVELGGGEDGLLAYFPANEGDGVLAYDRTSEASAHHLHLLGNPSAMWRTVQLFLSSSLFAQL